MLSTGISHPTFQAAYAPFTPSNSGQRSPPTYYRGCWHVVSRGFLPWYRHFLLPHRTGLQSEDLLPSRGVAGSGFPHCPIFPTAASRRSLDRVSVPVWPDQPLSPATIVGLVGPLPHQLPNGTRAHPSADFSLTYPDAMDMVLCGISNGFRCYPLLKAGCSRVTHPSATKFALPSEHFQSTPFDLHVLSTPPAFVLSQDQTLVENFITSCASFSLCLTAWLCSSFDRLAFLLLLPHYVVFKGAPLPALSSWANLTRRFHL